MIKLGTNDSETVKVATADQLIERRVTVRRKRTEVPLWQKGLLTLEEAAEYTGLGLQKLRELSNDDRCEFVLWNGAKRMFKRRKLEEYLDNQFSI